MMTLQKPALLLTLALSLVMSSALIACTRDADEPPIDDAAVVDDDIDRAPTEEMPAPPEEPSTDRTGAWVDEVVILEEPNADAAVSRLVAGDIDIYAFTVSSPSTYNSIVNAAGLDYKVSYGSYNEMTFNPGACTDANKLNPFAVPRIREAMNWLIDRNQIVQEIMGGLGTPRWVPINTASADRGRLAAEIRQIEAEYAYDLERAREVVAEEMETLGAELVDGAWTFGGAPVELVGVIRSEDERTQIGDYFAAQLQEIGFTVRQDYKTSAEAAPIWQQSEPTECLFHFYTGGWVTTAIDRDASTNFNFFYTPSGLPRPLWQAYTPSPEFEAIAQRLNDSDFTSLEERTDLFRQALPLAMQDSARIWLLDRSSAAPLRDTIEVSSDLSGSIYGTSLWPYTLRIRGQEGGTVRWASASILTEPWNPIAGTNWIYDAALYRAIGQWSFVSDPNTGLNWPHRVETFDVMVQEDLPVTQNLDWLTLTKVPEIVVPDDAWVDWDAETQLFMTAADVYTQTETALIKTTTTYPADLFDTISWHDGSSMSLADMVMSLIMTFDQSKEASAVYDEAQVPAFDSFMSTFKGIRITSENPVTVEFYSDNWSLDAENAISNLRTLWPYYGYGEAPWHSIAIGVGAESAGQAAFSAAKATAGTVEQLSYIAGPTLEILGNQLTSAAEAGTIPYSPTLSAYITADEAATRYANLQAWHADKGHYWVSTGPFYLHQAFPIEKTVVLRRNEAFPDPSDKWSRFAEPAIAEVEIDSSGPVIPGEEATFEIFVSFDDQPYAANDVSEVKYLVYDADGALADSGNAAPSADGLWQVVLGPEVTGGLAEGSSRLEVIVVSELVALPSLSSLEFVVTP